MAEMKIGLMREDAFLLRAQDESRIMGEQIAVLKVLNKDNLAKANATLEREDKDLLSLRNEYLEANR